MKPVTAGGLGALGMLLVMVVVIASTGQYASRRSRGIAPEAQLFAPGLEGYSDREQVQRRFAEVAPARAPMASADAAGPELAFADTVATAPSMLIRIGNAMVKVDSLEAAITAVQDLAKRVGGYVANTATQTGSGQVRRAMLELKIPAARFQQAVDGLKPIGEVESVNVEAQDVGEEFVDVTARMSNARRLEQRLISLLANRTGRLSDVLEIERELARVRGEIERYEGRLRFLRSRVATSTLNVTVHEGEPLVGEPGESVIGGAFAQAWRNLVWLVAFLIQALGIVVPVGALSAGGWWVWRRIRSRVNPRLGAGG